MKKKAEGELFQALKEQEFIIKLRQALVLDIDYNEINIANRNKNESERSGINPRLRKNEKLYFGNHYVGPIFDRHLIEECVLFNQRKYHAATKEEKERGLEVEFLEQLIDWKKESIIFPFLPKKHVKVFTEKSGVFMSKQVPLLLVAKVSGQDENDQEQQEIIKMLFKYGDDLRQDNLVLQFFRIMDEMWMEQNMNMEMVRYKVLETGY